MNGLIAKPPRHILLEQRRPPTSHHSGREILSFILGKKNNPTFPRLAEAKVLDGVFPLCFQLKGDFDFLVSPWESH